MAFVVKRLERKEDDFTGSPRYWLHRHLVGHQKARPYTRVHASDLMGKKDFCPREYALGLKYLNPRQDERATTADQLTWAYGHMIARQVIDWFAEMGKAWGDWVCEACEKKFEFSTRPPKCSCGSRAFRYEEVRFVSKQSWVGGAMDVLVDMGGPRLSVVEIKSIDKEELKKLVAPLAEHRWRTNLYMRLIAESDHPKKDRVDQQKAFVLYVTKGGYGHQDPEIRRWKLLDGDFSPFKEFEVERNDAETDELLARAALVKHYRQTGEIPLGICPTSICSRAKFCPQRDRCFSEGVC